MKKQNWICRTIGAWLRPANRKEKFLFARNPFVISISRLHRDLIAASGITLQSHNCRTVSWSNLQIAKFCILLLETRNSSGGCRCTQGNTFSIGVEGEMSKRNVEVNVAINSMQWNVKYIYIYIAQITFDWHIELNVKTAEKHEPIISLLLSYLLCDLFFDSFTNEFVADCNTDQC